MGQETGAKLGGEFRLTRDCLESSWMGRIARLSVARSAEKGTLSPVVQAHGTMKWSLSGVSRQSLEKEFCEVRVS
jgi:hypothetical protein